MENVENSLPQRQESITPPQAGLPAQVDTSLLAKLKTKWPIVLGTLGSIALFAAIIYAAYSYSKRGREIQPTPTVIPTVTPVAMTSPLITPVLTPLSNEQQKPTKEPEEIPVSDLCIVEKDEIIDLVNTFENTQMKRDARGVLALFTPPELPDDSSTYIHLSGSDAAGPRLYNSGQTNFNQSSFEILGTPSKNASGSCTVQVREQRSYYPQGVGGDSVPVQSYTVYFVAVKQDNNWKIERYLSDSSTHKYSGWGY